MPPNGALWLRCVVLMPTLPARSRLLDAERAVGVGAEHVVVEAEVGVVGDRDAFVLVVERDRDDHRAEDLLLHDPHAGPAAGDERRRDVEARVGLLGPLAAGDDLAAFVAAELHVALDAVAVRRGDDRADHRAGFVRVADLQHVRHLGQALDDRS